MPRTQSKSGSDSDASMHRLYYTPTARQKLARETRSTSLPRKSRKPNEEVMNRLYSPTRQRRAEAVALREARPPSTNTRSTTPTSTRPSSRSEAMYISGLRQRREILRRATERREREELEMEEQARMQERWARPTAAGRKLRQAQTANREQIGKIDRSQGITLARQEIGLQAITDMPEMQEQEDESLRRMQSPIAYHSPSVSSQVQAWLDAGSPPISDSESRANGRSATVPPAASPPDATTLVRPAVDPTVGECPQAREMQQQYTRISTLGTLAGTQMRMPANAHATTGQLTSDKPRSRVLPFAVSALGGFDLDTDIYSASSAEATSNTAPTAASDEAAANSVLNLPAVRALLEIETSINRKAVRKEGHQVASATVDVTESSDEQNKVVDTEVIEELVKLELREEASEPSQQTEGPRPQSPNEKRLAMRLAAAEAKVLSLSQQLVTARQEVQHIAAQPSSPVESVAAPAVAGATEETAQQLLLELSGEVNDDNMAVRPIDAQQRRNASSRSRGRSPSRGKRTGSGSFNRDTDRRHEQWQVQNDNRRNKRSPDEILASTRKKSIQTRRSATRGFSKGSRSPARGRAKTPQDRSVRSVSRTTRSVELADAARRQKVQDQAQARPRSSHPQQNHASVRQRVMGRVVRNSEL